jgi:hypothetical protein
MNQNNLNQTALIAVQGLLRQTATDLLRLWEKQEGGNDRDIQVLLAAAVLMLGAERPSAAAALSVAQGLAGSQAGRGLAQLAEALAAFFNSDSISPAYRSIVAGAVQAAAGALQECGRTIGGKSTGAFKD